jgi:DNA repair protein RadC
LNEDAGPEYQPRIRDIASADRPRERLLLVGERALSTAELLAIILRTGVGGENVVRLAERLLARFSGLIGLSKASVAELEGTRGIGQAKALEIKAALELGRRLMASAPEERSRVSSPSDVASLLMSEMALLEQEHLRLVLLDTRNRVIGTPTVYVGSLNTSVVRIAELFKTAIRENAAAIIVVHNHPSGDPSPSPEDVQITREIVRAGNLLDIPLLDHLVIAHQRFVSLKERGLGFD